MCELGFVELARRQPEIGDQIGCENGFEPGPVLGIHRAEIPRFQCLDCFDRFQLVEPVHVLLPFACVHRDSVVRVIWPDPRAVHGAEAENGLSLNLSFMPGPLHWGHSKSGLRG